MTPCPAKFKFLVFRKGERYGKRTRKRRLTFKVSAFRLEFAFLVEANFLDVPVVFPEEVFFSFFDLGVGATLGLAGTFLAPIAGFVGFFF